MWKVPERNEKPGHKGRAASGCSTTNWAAASPGTAAFFLAILSSAT